VLADDVDNTVATYDGDRRTGDRRTGGFREVEVELTDGHATGRKLLRNA
jgi:hypothetical protein